MSERGTTPGGGRPASRRWTGALRFTSDAALHGAPAGAGSARTLSRVFLAASFLPLAFAAWFVADAQRFAARAATAEGVVVALRTRSGGEAAPVFRFVAGDGRAVEAQSPLWTSPPAWAVGERATLRYDPSRPEEAVPATFVTTYFAALVLGGVGAVFLVLAAALAVVAGGPASGRGGGA